MDSFGQSQKINQLTNHFWDTIGDIAGYGLLSQNEKRKIFKNLPDATVALEAGIELGRRIQKQPIHLLGKVLGSAQLGQNDGFKISKGTARTPVGIMFGY